jgi:hypothetical protein
MWFLFLEKLLCGFFIWNQRIMIYAPRLASRSDFYFLQNRGKTSISQAGN